MQYILLLLIGLLAGGKKPKLPDVKGLEPDYQPGPVDRPQIDKIPNWLANVDALISSTPKPNAFYLIKPGDLASTIAGAALGSKNNGANRVRLIKCMTKVVWNNSLYVSDRHPSSWGTLFDVDGENLSAAFLPRHASAMQFMAQKEMPPRTISSTGGYVGDGPTGYFGLLWIPPFTATQNAVNCSGTNPPDWLLSQLE